MSDHPYSQAVVRASQMDKQNKEDALALVEFVQNRWFDRIFRGVLADKIREFQQSLEAISAESHRLDYSLHDVNRHVIRVLRLLQEKPYEHMLQLTPELAQVTPNPAENGSYGHIVA